MAFAKTRSAPVIKNNLVQNIIFWGLQNYDLFHLKDMPICNIRYRASFFAVYFT